MRFTLYNIDLYTSISIDIVMVGCSSRPCRPPCALPKNRGCSHLVRRGGSVALRIPLVWDVQQAPPMSLMESLACR